jgi:hypothetical protein
MKTFKEFKSKPDSTPVFESHVISELNEMEILEAERIYHELSEYVEKNTFDNLDEGILGKIIGGAAGFIIGPAVGKVIAKALGVEKGILYDMFTSRLVSAALGASLAKNLA